MTHLFKLEMLKVILYSWFNKQTLRIAAGSSSYKYLTCHSKQQQVIYGKDSLANAN